MSKKFCREHPTLCNLAHTEQQYLDLFKNNGKAQIIPHRGRVRNPGIVPRPNGPKGAITPPTPTAPSSTPNKPSYKPVFAKGKPLTATDTSVPSDIIVKAKLARASGIYDDTGFDVQKTQDYLDSQKLNYTVEPDYSNSQGLVLYDNDTNKPVIAYRGTDLSNLGDLLTDALATGGLERFSPEMSAVREQMESVINDLGKPQELVGFSRGSLFSMTLGNEYDIPTTELNPAISPQLVKTQNDGSFHDIFRTKGDPVSFLANGTSKDSNWRVRSIDPLKDTLNPFEEHALDQLITNNTPRRTSIEDYLNQNRQVQSTRTAEKFNMRNISEAIEAKLSFTDYMETFNRGDRFNGETFGARVYENSNYTRLWKEAGGVFTEQEQSLISAAPTGPVTRDNHSPEERKDFFNKSKDSQIADINAQIETESQAHALADKFSVEPDYVRAQLAKQTTIGGLSPDISSSLVDALSISNLGLGFVGGAVGAEETSLINDIVQLPEPANVALTGTLGGVNTSLLSEALSGSAITASELGIFGLAGGAGAIAQYYSQKAIMSALSGQSKDVVESVSGVSSGAIGGATASAVGSIVSGIASGSELGSIFAPETLGLSTVIGAGIGATIGGVSFGIEKGVEAVSGYVTQNPNPYYIGPAPMTSSNKDTLDYLNRQSFYQNLQSQDESQGITPEQRISLGVPTP